MLIGPERIIPGGTPRSARNLPVRQRGCQLTHTSGSCSYRPPRRGMNSSRPSAPEHSRRERISGKSSWHATGDAGFNDPDLSLLTHAVSSFPPEDTLRDMELSGQRSTALATKSGKRLQHLLSSRYSDEPSIPPATETGDLQFFLDKHWWPGILEQLQ